MSTQTRIAQLEKAQGTDKKIQYYCYSYEDAKEYIASPFVGVDGETFTFETQEAMTAFSDKHTQFELLHVQIVYDSHVIKDGE